ncbi:MAG: hypothetical protein RIT24_1574, partial [Planctomycetota bacterium]
DPTASALRRAYCTLEPSRARSCAHIRVLIGRDRFRTRRAVSAPTRGVVRCVSASQTQPINQPILRGSQHRDGPRGADRDATCARRDGYELCAVERSVDQELERRARCPGDRRAITQPFDRHIWRHIARAHEDGFAEKSTNGACCIIEYGCAICLKVGVDVRRVQGQHRRSRGIFGDDPKAPIKTDPEHELVGWGGRDCKQLALREEPPRARMRADSDELVGHRILDRRQREPSSTRVPVNGELGGGGTTQEQSKRQRPPRQGPNRSMCLLTSPALLPAADEGRTHQHAPQFDRNTAMSCASTRRSRLTSAGP